MNYRRFALVLSLSLLTSPSAFSASAVMLQFGSFETLDEAQQRLSEVKKTHAALLKDLSTSVREIKLPPDNLTVYRTQAGPVDSRGTAQGLCAKIATSGEECYVVETAMVSTPTAPSSTTSATSKATEAANAEPYHPALAPLTNPEKLVDPATAKPASAELKAALDEAVALQNTAPAPYAVTKPTPAPEPSFWSRLNPFSDATTPSAPAPTPVPAATASAPLDPISAPAVAAVPVTVVTQSDAPKAPEATQQMVPVITSKAGSKVMIVPPAAPEAPTLAEAKEVVKEEVADATKNATSKVMIVPPAAPEAPTLAEAKEVVKEEVADATKKAASKVMIVPPAAPEAPTMAEAAAPAATTLEQEVSRLAEEAASHASTMPHIAPSMHVAPSEPVSIPQGGLAALPSNHVASEPAAMAVAEKAAPAAAPAPIMAQPKPVAPAATPAAKVAPTPYIPPDLLPPPPLLSRSNRSAITSSPPAEPLLAKPQPVQPPHHLADPALLAEPATTTLPAARQMTVPAPSAPIVAAATLPPATAAVAAPHEDAGSVRVEEAKRVPLTEEAVKPVVPGAPLHQITPAVPTISLLPSSTLGRKTLWAQIGEFDDPQMALAFWETYRQSHPDFPVVRLRVASSLQQQMHGNTRVWLRVGPFGRAAFIHNLCGSIPRSDNIRCGVASDSGVAGAAGAPIEGYISGSRYPR